MQSVLTTFVHLLLTFPFYVIVALVGVTFLAWRSGPGSRLHAWRHALAAAALLAVAVSSPPIPNAITNDIEAEYPIPSEADLAALTARGNVRIVVLTGGWFRSTERGYEVNMGGNSWERTWLAVKLWRRIGGDLIFTGAPLPDGSDSVAKHMAEVAANLGVPEDRILIETRSENTRENLQNTQAMFGLGPDQSIVLVTSALNMPRAMGVAHALGIAVLAYPCNFEGERVTGWRPWLPNNDAPGELERVLHEWIGLRWYRLRGWA